MPGFRVAARLTRAAEALRSLEALPRWTSSSWTTTCPTRTGLAVVQEMRRRGHETDVIMVTAARDVSTVQAAMRQGRCSIWSSRSPSRGCAPSWRRTRTLRRTLDGGGEAEQAEVDRIFGALSSGPEPELPKGHSPTTAELVRRALVNAEGPAVRPGDRRAEAG